MNLNFKVNPEKNCIKYVKAHNENKFSNHSYGESIVRGDYQDSLISILFNTNNLKNTSFILNEFLKKTKNPKNIQFCMKIDNDDQNIVNEFINILSKYKFNFIVLASPKGRGFVDLWQWVNFLYKCSSKKSKFVMNISDEMYIKQKNWDIKLEGYIGVFEDEIFRLRTSVFKNRNYTDLYECGYAPDTTAIYSRKYLEIQGDFSPCFGPDNGQQFVAYYLSVLNLPRHYQFSRDLVSEGIDFHGQGTNIGLSESQKERRNQLNLLLWSNMFRYENQNLYFKRARKIQIEILKKKYKNLQIKNIGYKYLITLKINNEHKVIELNNYMPKIKFIIFKLSKMDFIKNNTGFDSIKIKGYFITLCLFFYKKIPFKNYKKGDEEFFKKFEYFSKDSKLYNFFDTNGPIVTMFKIIYPIDKTIFIFFIFFYIKLFIFLIYFFLYHLYNPKAIPQTIFEVLKKIFPLKRVNSHIFFEENEEQSERIILKGD